MLRTCGSMRCPCMQSWVRCWLRINMCTLPALIWVSFQTSYFLIVCVACDVTASCWSFLTVTVNSLWTFSCLYMFPICENHCLLSPFTHCTLFVSFKQPKVWTIWKHRMTLCRCFCPVCSSSVAISAPTSFRYVSKLIDLRPSPLFLWIYILLKVALQLLPFYVLRAVFLWYFRPMWRLCSAMLWKSPICTYR